LATEAPQETTDDTPEMQASYTTTDEPTEVFAPAQDDRYAIDASEPAPPDAQPLDPDAPAASGSAEVTEDAANATPPANGVRLANAPTFTPDELSAALEEAKKAQPSLVSGNLADSKEIARAKGYSYSMLADLAQKSAFVDASAPAETTQPLQQEIEELFHQTLSDAHTRNEVALIVPKWLASPNRKHGGVFFAASKKSEDGEFNLSMTDTGGGFGAGLHEFKAYLEGGSSINVLLPSALGRTFVYSKGPMGIVGWIVDRPADQVPGYTGNTSQVVWVARLIPLE
jgi:hypothetical protein